MMFILELKKRFIIIGESKSSETSTAENLLMSIAWLFVYGFLRVLPAIGVLLYTFFASKYFSVNQGSEAILYLAYLYLMSFIAKLGIDSFVLKEVSLAYDGEARRAKTVYYRAAVEVVVLSVLLLGFYYASISLLGRFNITSKYFLILPVFSLMGLQSIVLKASGCEKFGALLEVGFASLLATVLAWIKVVVDGFVELEEFLNIFLISCFFVVLAQLFILRGVFKGVFAELSFVLNLHHWLALKSWKFSVVNVCSYLIEWLPVFILSSVSPESVVILALAIRLATVAGFAVSTIDLISAPKVSRLYVNGEKGQLREYLRSLRKVMFVPAVLIVLFAYPIFLLLERAVLAIDSEGVSLPAYILISSHAISLLIGPVGYVLMMTGYEGVSAKVKAVLLVIIGAGAWGISAYVDDVALICVLVAALMAACRVIPNLYLASRVNLILAGEKRDT